MSRAVGLISAGAAVFAVSGIAEADEILIAKSTSSSAHAMYRKDSSGQCTEQLVPQGIGPTRWAQGTSGNDVIYVYDDGPGISWCGISNIQPIQEQQDEYLYVIGGNGSDIIWGGSGTGDEHVVAIFTGTTSETDTHQNFVYAGGAEGVFGANKKDTILIPGPTFVVEGGGDGDVFCTETQGVFSNPNVGSIWGDSGVDVRIGPPASNEVSIELKGPTDTTVICYPVLVQMYGAVLTMLSE